MITILLVFLGSLLLLHLADRATGLGRVLFGLHLTYVKVNIALLAGAAFSTERILAGVSRTFIYTTFGLIALIDLFWAGYLGRQAKQKER